MTYVIHIDLGDGDNIVAGAAASRSVLSLIRAEDAAMRSLQATWNPGEPWQCKLKTEDQWRDLPAAHRPGWFYDTDYRKKPI